MWETYVHIIVLLFVWDAATYRSVMWMGDCVTAVHHRVKGSDRYIDWPVTTALFYQKTRYRQTEWLTTVLFYRERMHTHTISLTKFCLILPVAKTQSDWPVTTALYYQEPMRWHSRLTIHLIHLFILYATKRHSCLCTITNKTSRVTL